jgi:hypothetical protein
MPPRLLLLFGLAALIFAAFSTAVLANEGNRETTSSGADLSVTSSRAPLSAPLHVDPGATLTENECFQRACAYSPACESCNSLHDTVLKTEFALFVTQCRLLLLGQPGLPCGGGNDGLSPAPGESTADFVARCGSQLSTAQIGYVLTAANDPGVDTYCVHLELLQGAKRVRAFFESLIPRERLNSTEEDIAGRGAGRGGGGFDY